MRKRRPIGSCVGPVCILLGMIVIMSLVLPSGFWWFILGVGLIALGIFWSKRCM